MSWISDIGNKAKTFIAPAVEKIEEKLENLPTLNAEPEVTLEQDQKKFSRTDRLSAYAGGAGGSVEPGSTPVAVDPIIAEAASNSASQLLRGGKAMDLSFEEGRINQMTIKDSWYVRGEIEKASENFQKPVSPEHQAVFKDLSTEKQKDSFRFMSDAERAQFVEVYNAVKSTPRAAHSMRLLLQSDAFEEALNRNGKPLLDTLSRFQKSELDPRLQAQGVRKDALLGQLVRELAYPTVFQGENTDNCAPSTVQTIMASGMPGEYARMVTDLVTKGEAELFGEKTLGLSLDDLGGEDGRRALDSLIQGSFEEFAKQFAAVGEEYGGRGGGGGTYRGNDGTGLTSNQVAKLYQHVVGNEPVVAKVEGENADKIFDRTLQALDAGLYVPGGLDIDGQDDGYGHAITLMEYNQERGEITYSDSIDEKIKTMPVEEFKKRLVTDGMVILPEAFALGLEKQKPSLMERFEEAIRHPIAFFTREVSPDDWGGRGGGGGTSR